MTKNITKKLFLVFFVTLFLLYIGSSLREIKIDAVDYQLSSAWLGSDLDITPQENIIYDSNYSYFSEIIETVASVNTDKIYVIESAFDLYMLSVLSMGLDKTTYLSLNYALGNNIDYYEIVQQNINQRFHPIGFIEPFTGSFDGQGFEITNLYFDSIMSEEDYQTMYSGLRYVSMFSKVSSTGHIHDLGLINPIIIQPIEWGIMNYVSALVGENYGLVENIYLIDNRADASGFNAEGTFHLSGLVSVNYGTFRNSFISSEHIKSISVGENESTSAVLYQNYGTISHLYYDSEIYTDVNGLTNYSQGLTKLGFQNPIIFDSGWFYNNHYQVLASNDAELAQLTLNNDYPTLQGLAVTSLNLELNDATDFILMNELFVISGAFRNAEYLVSNDIDMNQVSSDGYRAASIGFNGRLSSAVNEIDTILYERNPLQGGDINYHSIINLKINQPTYIGNYASYGLFSSLFGVVENLNFVNTIITTDDLDKASLRAEILVGVISGKTNHAVITNVHVNSQTTMGNSLNAISQLSIGGLVGKGSGSISYSTTNGSLVGGSHTYDVQSNLASIGGIVGKANLLTLSNVMNAMDIEGISFNATNLSTVFTGGVIGSGTIETIEKVVNLGSLTSSQEGKYLHKIEMGGIFGQLTDIKDSISFLYNMGSLNLVLESDVQVNLAGIGNIYGSAEEISILGLTNQGLLTFIYPVGSDLTSLELSQMDVNVSGVLITDLVEGHIEGLFNMSNLNLDLDIIDKISGTLIVKNTNSINLFQSYNTGHINLETKNELEQSELMVSGNVIGTNISFEHLHNEGNITIDINHSSSPSVVNGNFYVFGLFNEISQDQKAANGYNGGNISILQNQATVLNYNVYASGLAYKNSNTNYFSENSINPTSVEISDVVGSMDNFINDGDVTINGSFNGHSIASGALIINESSLTGAANLGDITNENNVTLANGRVESSGVVGMMIGQYARVKDSANYGDIIAVSTTANGYTLASGVVGRNDKLENGSDVSSGTNHKYGKILFSINYGNIYSYSNIDESAFTITSETRSKASGIFGQGLITIIDVINYGNVFSKYLASGIFGFASLDKFGTIAQDQVYLANIINYGKIRAISAYDGTFTINMSVFPTRTVYNAFGTFIGKFHTGTTSWEFLTISTLALYPIDLINFGYYINFDNIGNLLGNAPTVTLDRVLTENGDGGDLLLNILNKMSTTNPNDSSANPFNLFVLGVLPHTANYGKKIASYSLDESSTGIFFENFIFRNPPNSFFGTNQYLKNYFSYIPRAKINDDLLTRIESGTSNFYTGIYALASSSGVGNGIYIPDHIDLKQLNPQMLNGEPDLTWLGIDSDPDSVIYKLTIGMRQIKATYAATIYDLAIEQVDINGNPIVDGLTLKKPIIDQERGLLTYYLPSNASIISSLASQQMSAVGYIEAGEGHGHKIPDFYENGVWSYKWVGDYKKVGEDYVPIGPYNVSGEYNLGFSADATSLKFHKSTNITTPVYDKYPTDTDILNPLPNIYTFLPFIKEMNTLTNYFWVQTGYTVNSVESTSPGYGPYKIKDDTPTEDGVTYSTSYEYVGPSTELVTYVMTSEAIGGPVTPETPGVITLYEDAGFYFQASLDESNYMIAAGASLYDNGTPHLTSATIPLSYGIYDAYYDSVTYEIFDSVSNHYGSVRVFSDNYDAYNPATYRDYQIRIIRTADQSLLGINQLQVNGLNALPTYTDFRTLIASELLHYEQDGNLGIMSATYQTNNIADDTNVLPLISLYDDNTGTLIDPAIYRLSKGIVVNPNSLDNITGILGEGTVTIELEVTDLLPSGSYRMELKLVTDETAMLYVDKIQSSNAIISLLEYNNRDIALLGDTYTSSIPFGIYYDSSDSQTEIVNFTNLSTLSNIYFSDLNQEQIPSYLTNLEISPFATLESVSLSITMVDSYRHNYRLTYVIHAEDGTVGIYYHDLVESIIDQDPMYVYKNGGEVELGIDPLVIGYLEAPTIRVEFDLAETYGDYLTVTTNFIPENIGEEAIIEQDYYVTLVPFVGYEIDMNQDTSLGLYQINSTYDHSLSLWGQTLVWHYDFTTVELTKVKNDDSNLKNIMFVSDTIYSGFNTVVDVLPITEISYTDYLTNPENRVITVLPTTGIYYGDYSDYQDYWVIGQVQKTNLSYYMPTFELPDGAIIRRVTDFVNVDYSYQSEDLVGDFTAFGSDFNFVIYRVYAHDFDDNQTHYSDYYVAVQDMTNNIKFNLEVINNSSQNVTDIFVRINVCQLGENYEGLCLYEDSVLSMITQAIYNPYLGAFENNQFQTTIYGTYQMIIDVPDDISYSITLQSSPITGSSFYLENSILPRRYYIVVTLTDDFIEEPWGQEITVENISNMNDLDLFRTYQSGEMFSYQGQIYKVQDGFTYIYSALTKPGTSALLGLVNVSYVYEQTSTYVIGDVVYYQNAYYECLLLNDLGYAPDATGIGLGYFVLIT